MKALLSLSAVCALVLVAGTSYACSCAAGPNGNPPPCSQAGNDCQEDEHAVCICTATSNLCNCKPD